LSFSTSPFTRFFYGDSSPGSFFVFLPPRLKSGDDVWETEGSSDANFVVLSGFFLDLFFFFVCGISPFSLPPSTFVVSGAFPSFLGGESSALRLTKVFAVAFFLPVSPCLFHVSFFFVPGAFHRKPYSASLWFLVWRARVV